MGDRGSRCHEEQHLAVTTLEDVAQNDAILRFERT